MFSVRDFKGSLNERLSAAALEIFTVFQRTIAKYEEEIDRHRRLLDIRWKSKKETQNAGCLKQHVCKEEAHFEQQLDNQEEPELLQVKMEQEEVCISEDTVKLEPDDVLEAPVVGQGDHSEQLNYSYVRELISETLTAAVKETFTDFENSISRFEEERRLMEILWQPQVRLYRTEVSQQHACKEEEEEEEVLFEQQLNHQERNWSVDQEEPEPQQIKEQEEELGAGECLSTKQQYSAMMQFSHSSSATESLEEQTESRDITSGYRNAEKKAEEVSGFGVSRKVLQSTANSKRCRRVHRNGNPEKCDICGKTFASVNKLKRHLKIHTGGKPCKICGKHLRSEYHLRVHMRNHTKIVCNVCDRSFNHPSQLKIHAMIHAGEKPYICETCGKTFSQQGNLTVHMRTHTGEKPYLCEACGRRFIYPTHLKSHMRIHTDVKMYSCEKCGKSFRHKITLSRHMVLHTDKRQHSCIMCNRDFRDRYTLTVHMRTHTGEKPHVCSTCGRGFSRLTHLQYHLLTHSGVKPYSCVTCGRGFSEKDSLLGHMRSHTGEELFTGEK